MNEHVKKYLLDIYNSTVSIETFLGKQRSFKKFKTDKLLKRGIERELEIIGEAMNRVLKIENDIPIQHAKKIVSLRNLIIHSYDSVVDEMIYGVAVNHVPKLKEEVARLLEME